MSSTARPTKPTVAEARPVTPASGHDALGPDTAPSMAASHPSSGVVETVDSPIQSLSPTVAEFQIPDQIRNATLGASDVPTRSSSTNDPRTLIIVGIVCAAALIGAIVLFATML